MIAVANPVGLRGIEFVEFASADPAALDRLFKAFGFSKVKRHRSKSIDYYQQNEIRFLLNSEPRSFGSDFSKVHGPSICSMGWKVEDAAKALEVALRRGATLANKTDFRDARGRAIPAIYGIGNSLIYFVDDQTSRATGLGDDPYTQMGFEDLPSPERVREKGFISIDHLTNNVHAGTLQRWADFYRGIFGFTDVRYFDIQGVRTGLQSFALRSPCGSFCIPINEGTEAKSQINEYLDEYRGPGIQHLAFLTNDILGSLEQLEGTDIQTLDIDDDYYATVFDRVPHVTEDHQILRRRQVLVDGDDQGYLLQIFTRNIIGPIFIEIIQRKNHSSFGEGNFGALFRSIERDQMRRGVFEEGECKKCANCACDQEPKSLSNHLAFRKFSTEENWTWRTLFARQAPKRSEQIVDRFSEGLRLLEITGDRVPDLDRVNRILSGLTGFQGVPVEGYETPENFFRFVADRKFPVGNFIRDAKDLNYTPAPDVFHDLYGHLPFFAKPDYAEFCRDFAFRALKFADRPELLRQFERVFWFTIEFGLIQTPRGRRVFGAGIASSFGECAYALSDQPEIVPFDLEVMRRQEFRIDEFQKRLFIMESEAQLFGCLDLLEGMVRGRS